MYRLFVSAAATAALAAALIVVPAWGATAKLSGEVGPGFHIDVEKGGKDLKTVKAGKYKIKVEDKSTFHNFHLIGPGLNKKTTVSFKGDTTWTITLKKGKYTYQCDPHAASGMKGSFRVT
jgi:plastocyanin